MYSKSIQTEDKNERWMCWIAILISVKNNFLSDINNYRRFILGKRNLLISIKKKTHVSYLMLIKRNILPMSDFLFLDLPISNFAISRFNIEQDCVIFIYSGFDTNLWCNNWN